MRIILSTILVILSLAHESFGESCQRSLECKLNQCSDNDPEKFSECRLVTLYEELLICWDDDNYREFVSNLVRYHRNAVGMVKTVGSKNMMIRNRDEEMEIMPDMESTYYNHIKRTRIQTYLHDNTDHITRSMNLVEEHNRRYVKNADGSYSEFYGPERTSWRDTFAEASNIIPTIGKYQNKIVDSLKSISQSLYGSVSEDNRDDSSKIFNSIGNYAKNCFKYAKKLYAQDGDDEKGMTCLYSAMPSSD